MTVTFQKRHYEAIAQALQRCQLDTVWSPEAKYGFELAQVALTNMFSMDNSAFNRDRFWRACEPGANVSARAEHKQGNQGGA